MYDIIYFPIWLEYSGLPELLNSKIRSGAWSVFKKIVELDCSFNTEPGAVETSIREISVCVGLSAEIVEKILTTLQKKEYIAAFIPDNEEELGIFKIKIPVKTPCVYEEVLKQHNLSLKRMNSIPSDRYARDKELNDKQKRELQELIDLYLSTVSQKINGFTLEQLKLIKLNFPLHNIKKAFDIAKKNDINSLHWIIKSLYGEKEKNGDEKRK